MSILVKILRAAHCRSTHHFFAIDALGHVQTSRGKQLASVLLSNHKQYLKGAKEPDTTFRDFQNHVLHVGDNHWGGACRAAEKWLANSLQSLDEGRLSDTAFAIGVLSHYFTDPLMPLHTGSSDDEGPVHRPMEWSVCKSYQQIYSQWKSSSLKRRFTLSDGPHWIRDAVTQGALLSYPNYHKLIELYDLKRGVKKPPAGLNSESRAILATLFGYSITGVAAIVDRIAELSTHPIPAQKLSLSTLSAALQMPSAWITKRIESAEERRAIKAIYDEFQQTGTVVENLPAEITTVRSAKKDQQTQQPEQVQERSVREANSASDSEVVVQPSSSARRQSLSAGPSVSVESDLVDAPSIGPKTARRFTAIGIHTIGQFLAADPIAMAQRLETRWIDDDLLAQWQDQARLVCDVASLCGYKAQLLVSIGCRTSQLLAEANPGKLHQEIQAFADTKPGQRILRSSRVPDQNDVNTWVEDAQSIKNHRAA